MTSSRAARPRHAPTRVVGLTGSIGMGKTTTARQLRGMGFPVYDADAVVHRLLARGGAAVPRVRTHFPEAVRNNRVDRAVLGQIVYNNPQALAQLESLLHPLVNAARDAWIAARQKDGEPVVFLDIPLLFEVGWDRACDAVIVVTAPEAVQTQRVLARPGMTRQRLQDILSHQMADADKRARADFLVNTGEGLAHSRRDLRRILECVLSPTFRTRKKAC